MSISIVLTQMVIIFCLMAVGILFRKRKLVDEHGAKQISAIVTNVCNPALIFTSAFTQDSQISNHEVFLIALIALGLFLVLILFGKLIGPLLHFPKNEWDDYGLMTVFGNLGFIGIPLVSALLGTSCLIYIAIFNLMNYFFIYTYGLYLLCRQSGEKKKTSWKLFVNPGTVASAATVVFFLLKLPLPQIASESLTYMGNATVFLAMFIIGTTLADASLKEIFREYRLYLFIAIRFVLFPILLALLMRVFTNDSLIVGTTVFMSAVPVGSMPLMLAKERNMEAVLLSKGILLSTILSLVTIPVVAFFL